MNIGTNIGTNIETYIETHIEIFRPEPCEIGYMGAGFYRTAAPELSEQTARC